MRLSVRTKLLGGFLAVVALLVFLGVFSILEMGRINANGRYIGVNSVPSIVVINGAERAVRTYRQDQLQHVIATTNEQMDALQADMHAEAEVVAKQLDAYRGMFTNAKDIALWRSVRDGWSSYRRQSAPFLAPSRALQTKRAVDVLDGQARTTFARLARDLQAWTQFNVDIANGELRHNASSYTSARWTVIGIIVGAALIALVLAFLIARGITRGVVQMLGAARGIAVGDVDQQVDTRSRDELGETAAAFRAMIAYLKETASVAERIAAGDLTVAVEPKSERDQLGQAFATMASNLHGLISQVADAATAMGASSQQMAASSEETGRAVGDIASAVGGVAEGAERQVAVVAQAQGATAETTTAAEQALSVVQEGIAAAEQAHASMEALRASTTGVTETMERLASKSEQIGGIVEAITGIAEQTNLLALNAAIEAARAGEQGRGFAVVAEEVRKLAEESGTAAASIASLVTEIQSETGNAVAVVTSSARQAIESGETVEAAREAFARIGVSVGDVRNRIAEIEHAAGEVAAVAAQSSAASEQVSASTEETSASAQEVAASAQELASTADALGRVVGRFRLA